MNLPVFKDAVFIKRVSELHEQLQQYRLGGSCCLITLKALLVLMLAHSLLVMLYAHIPVFV